MALLREGRKQEWGPIDYTGRDWQIQQTEREQEYEPNSLEIAPFWRRKQKETNFNFVLPSMNHPPSEDMYAFLGFEVSEDLHYLQQYPILLGLSTYIVQTLLALSTYIVQTKTMSAWATNKKNKPMRSTFFVGCSIWTWGVVNSDPELRKEYESTCMLVWPWKNFAHC